MIVDETFHQSSPGCYELARIHHHDGHVLRVRICRDSYRAQSSAVVEVLTPQYTWTALATTPAPTWHDRTRGSAADLALLASIADDLVDRVHRILTTTPTSDTTTPASR